jgi:hypothetical protein
MSDSIVIALIGVAGAIVGSIATVMGNLVIHFFKEWKDNKKDVPAKSLLLEMLSDEQYKWRSLETLMHVIGSNETKTKALLLELGARASEDGKSLWALKSRVPLNTLKNNA